MKKRGQERQIRSLLKEARAIIRSRIRDEGLKTRRGMWNQQETKTRGHVAVMKNLEEEECIKANKKD